MTRLWLALVTFLVFVSPISAGQLADPTGKILLTISGQIEHTNGDGIAQFDRAMLESLDWREFRTFTSFSDGEQVFEGPTLASVLRVVGASGGTLDATAINDYTTEIPITDIEEHEVFLAMVWGGKTMRVRNKGPIWVVYPLAENETAARPFDGKMIWQLDRLNVR